MIRITSKGDFKKVDTFFEKILNVAKAGRFDTYGERGVAALQSATPKKTGKTASSWRYEITRTPDRVSLDFLNSNDNNGVNIAIILQYGHATGWGGYVQGIDYINPALQPIFEEMLNSMWKEVASI